MPKKRKSNNWNKIKGTNKCKKKVVTETEKQDISTQCVLNVAELHQVGEVEKVLTSQDKVFQEEDMAKRKNKWTHSKKQKKIVVTKTKEQDISTRCVPNIAELHQVGDVEGISTSKMPVRRKSDPINVVCIWEAFQHIRMRGNEPDHQRVIDQLIINNGYTQREWETCIRDTLADNLIQKYFLQNAGTDVYTFPTGGVPRQDGKDWYCFECHNAGVVVHCANKTCRRVFHKDCSTKSAPNYQLYKNCFTAVNSTVHLKEGLPKRRKSLYIDVEDLNSDSESEQSVSRMFYDENLCIPCNLRNLDKFSFKMTELNRLLKYVLKRVKSWVPKKVTEKIRDADDTTKDEVVLALTPLTKYIFFESMDMITIEKKLAQNGYTNCSAFLTDLLVIRHNIGLFHGGKSQEYAATEFIMRDALHDLTEIIVCMDCYQNSNDQINRNWFSFPCRTPHEIVWAKQFGYCHWPAKVISKTDTHYDVRYFGGKHERALVPKLGILPITTSQESLKLKFSQPLRKAIEEMELHQELLGNPSALEALMVVRENKSPCVKPTQYDKKPYKRKLSPSPELFLPGTSSRPGSRQLINDLNLELSSLETGKPAKRMRRQATLPTMEDLEVLLTLKESENATEKAKRSLPSRLRKGSKSSLASSIICEETSKRKAGRQKKVIQGEPLIKSTGPSKSVDKSKKAGRSEDVICISDNDDENSGNINKPNIESIDEGCDQLEQVTSSTEIRFEENAPLIGEMQQLDHPFSDEVEKMRRELEGLSASKEVIICAMNCMQKEIDRLTDKHNSQIKSLNDSHREAVSGIKKKQWCYYCEQDAIYHCCWNTAYCSTTCQQLHWQDEHRTICRRKKYD